MSNFGFAFGRSLVPNIGNRNRVTDAERLRDIKENSTVGAICFTIVRPNVTWLGCWNNWTSGRRNIARLEERLEESDWILLLP